MSKDDENRGMNDFAVTKCNIISSAGKHLDKLVDNPWNGITLNESIGLQAGDPQFISGEIFLNDEIDISNDLNSSGDSLWINYRIGQERYDIGDTYCDKNDPSGW